MRRKGFTLIELLVVVMIIAILATTALPKYRKTVESARATDAFGTLVQIANANRMYRIDNAGAYQSGAITTACNAAACGAAAPTSCNLIVCNYMAKMDWTGMGYNYFACNAGAGGACCAAGAPAATGCATRKTGAAPGTNTTPYKNWGYRLMDDGTFRCLPSATAACNGANDPPKPAS